MNEKETNSMEADVYTKQYLSKTYNELIFSPFIDICRVKGNYHKIIIILKIT